MRSQNIKKPEKTDEQSDQFNAIVMCKLVLVNPQPTYIESSSRWLWPLPLSASPGCVVTASREWWEYVPSEAKPHPMAKGVMLRDGIWYWAMSDTTYY